MSKKPNFEKLAHRVYIVRSQVGLKQAFKDMCGWRGDGKHSKNQNDYICKEYEWDDLRNSAPRTYPSLVFINRSQSRGDLECTAIHVNKLYPIIRKIAKEVMFCGLFPIRIQRRKRV